MKFYNISKIKNDSINLIKITLSFYFKKNTNLHTSYNIKKVLFLIYRFNLFLYICPHTNQCITFLIWANLNKIDIQNIVYFYHYGKIPSLL